MTIKSELSAKRIEEAKKERNARILKFIERYGNRRKIPIPKIGCFLRQGIEVLVASYKKVGPGAICLPVGCSSCRNYTGVSALVKATGKVSEKELNHCICGGMPGDEPKAHCFAIPDHRILPKEGVPFILKFSLPQPAIAEEEDLTIARMRRAVAAVIRPKVPMTNLEALKAAQQELFTRKIEVKPLYGGQKPAK